MTAQSPPPRQPSRVSSAAEWALAWSPCGCTVSEWSPALPQGESEHIRMAGDTGGGSRRGAGVLSEDRACCSLDAGDAQEAVPSHGPRPPSGPRGLNSGAKPHCGATEHGWSQCSRGPGMRPGCPCKASAAMVGRGVGGPRDSPLREAPPGMLGPFPSGGDDRSHVSQGLSAAWGSLVNC